GLSRFGIQLPGAIVPAFDLQGGDVTGTGKLLAGSLASQVGWLYPLAVLAFVFGIVWRHGAPRTDRLRAGLLMWGLWLAATVIALAGVGVVLMAVARLTERARGRLAILGVAVAVVAMLGTPGAWATSVLDLHYSGSVIDASAGPVGGVGPVSPQTTAMV